MITDLKVQMLPAPWVVGRVAECVSGHALQGVTVEPVASFDQDALGFDEKYALQRTETSGTGEFALQVFSGHNTLLRFSSKGYGEEFVPARGAVGRKMTINVAMCAERAQ